MKKVEIDNIEISTSVIVVALIILLATAGIAFAVLTYIYRIHSIGTVQAIGVQIKDDQGNIVTHIDWGTLTPNSVIDFHCFAINNGTVPITLTLTTENWNPTEAANHLTLTWDYLGDTINPGQSHPIIFALTVSETVTGISNFSFDIVITAQEV